MSSVATVRWMKNTTLGKNSMAKIKLSNNTGIDRHAADDNE